MEAMGKQRILCQHIKTKHYRYFKIWVIDTQSKCIFTRVHFHHKYTTALRNNNNSNVMTAAKNLMQALLSTPGGNITNMEQPQWHLYNGDQCNNKAASHREHNQLTFNSCNNHATKIGSNRGCRNKFPQWQAMSKNWIPNCAQTWGPQPSTNDATHSRQNRIRVSFKYRIK